MLLSKEAHYINVHVMIIHPYIHLSVHTYVISPAIQWARKLIRPLVFFAHLIVL